MKSSSVPQTWLQRYMGYSQMSHLPYPIWFYLFRCIRGAWHTVRSLNEMPSPFGRTQQKQTLHIGFNLHSYRILWWTQLYPVWSPSPEVRRSETVMNILRLHMKEFNFYIKKSISKPFPSDSFKESEISAL